MVFWCFDAFSAPRIWSVTCQLTHSLRLFVREVIRCCRTSPVCLALVVWCHVCPERADTATNLLRELDVLLSKRMTLKTRFDEMNGEGLTCSTTSLTCRAALSSSTIVDRQSCADDDFIPAASCRTDKPMCRKDLRRCKEQLEAEITRWEAAYTALSSHCQRRASVDHSA